MPQAKGLPFFVGLLTLLKKAVISRLFDLPPFLRRVVDFVLETETGSRFCFGFLCVCVFLGSYPRHLEVPRPGVELEL